MTDSMADIIVQRDEWMQSAKQLDTEIAAFKKQCACRWCGKHHFNVSVCSKCAFTKKQEPHYTASLEQEIAALKGQLAKVEARENKLFEGYASYTKKAEQTLTALVGALDVISKKCWRMDSPAVAFCAEELDKLLTSPEVAKWRTK